MAIQLHEGVVKKPGITLRGKVECDEVYVVAGHKGNPDAYPRRVEKAAGIG